LCSFSFFARLPVISAAVLSCANFVNLNITIMLPRTQMCW
jgi:hypothetical protein